MEKYVGRWAFLAGVALSIIAGLVPAIAGDTTTFWVLIILGLIVAALNITKAEEIPFLIASIALMLVGNSLGNLPELGKNVSDIVAHLQAFVAPAALVIALKTIWELARQK